MRDFKLLGNLERGKRYILPFSPSQLTVSYLAHDIHFQGVSDNALVEHSDWKLFGLNGNDVVRELKNLALNGEIILQSSVTCSNFMEI